ncbi:MAG TPA: hypothetical protein VHE37_12305 [Nevskiaceae bacterium]|nr:hypothetical protein [Nevskiaceae bacterium]
MNTLLRFAAGVVFIISSIVSMPAQATASDSEFAQAEASCHAENQKVRTMETRGLSEEQMSGERAAYERACARLETLQGKLQPGGTAEIAAYEVQPAMPAGTQQDCSQKKPE